MWFSGPKIYDYAYPRSNVSASGLVPSQNTAYLQPFLADDVSPSETLASEREPNEGEVTRAGDHSISVFPA